VLRVWIFRVGFPIRTVAHQLGAGADDAENIVEVVGHAAGEPSDGLHTLAICFLELTAPGINLCFHAVRPYLEFLGVLLLFIAQLLDADKLGNVFDTMNDVGDQTIRAKDGRVSPDSSSAPQILPLPLVAAECHISGPP